MTARRNGHDRTCTVGARRGLAGADDAVAPPVDAIRDGRQLLDEPDPLTPVLDSLTDMLRSEYSRLYDELEAARQERHRRARELRTSGGFLEPIRAVGDHQPMPARRRPPTSRISPSRDALVAALTQHPSRRSATASRSSRADAISPGRRQPCCSNPRVSRFDPPPDHQDTGDLNAYLNEVRALVEPHLSDEKSVII